MSSLRKAYFLGIGGIGMSAVARYLRAQGWEVRGYDRSPSPLTQTLQEEGIAIDYAKPTVSWTKEEALVVYTPAIHPSDPVFTYFQSRGFTILKRSEILGRLTAEKTALCVAGTHGKTTTSAMIAHILSLTEQGTNAFLGGISNQVHSNLMIRASSPLVVVEADEYDRSFYHLQPAMSVITAIDPDHLDIYGTAEQYQAAFDHYATLVSDAIVLNERYTLHGDLQARVYTYSASSETAAFRAENTRVDNGEIYFDWVYPAGRMEQVRLGVPAPVNVENATAAMALAYLNHTDLSLIRRGIETFRGVYRRFNRLINTPRIVYIDDYAHHPAELRASIAGVRKLYPDRYLLVVFQPHLYSRTRDFQEGFRQALRLADEYMVLPIYPAREQPIPGVTGQLLGGEMVEKETLSEVLKQRMMQVNKPIVLMTLGAGDIDRLTKPICEAIG